MTVAVYPLNGAFPLYNAVFKKGHLTAAVHLNVEIHLLSKNRILHLSRCYFMWNYNMKISWNEKRKDMYLHTTACSIFQDNSLAVTFVH